MQNGTISEGSSGDARKLVSQAQEALNRSLALHAKNLLEKALALDPGNKSALELLATLPALPEGLSPVEGASFQQETGLPVEVVCDASDSPMVLVPKGKFTMGRNAGPKGEGPEHEVYLNTFYIDKFEVTTKQYVDFLGKEGIKDGKATRELFEENVHGIVWRGGRWQPAPRLQKHPMVAVSWLGASAYASWAGLDLPTEAQWEKAARSTDGRSFPWGEDFSTSKCNCKESGAMHSTPVDAYPSGASPYGCWDMAGNVWEWCFDWHSPDYYASSPDSEPLGPAKGEKKALRSCGWGAPAQSAHCCSRFFAPPEIHLEKLGGFRCVKLLIRRPAREEYKRGLLKKITTSIRKKFKTEKRTK